MPNGKGTWDPQYGTWEPDDPIYTCDRCDAKSKDEDFLTEVSLDFWVCPECLEEYAPCFWCGSLTHYDDIVELNGNQYCADCAGELEDEQNQQN